MNMEIHLFLDGCMTVVRIEDDFQFVRVRVLSGREIDTLEYA